MKSVGIAPQPQESILKFKDEKSTSHEQKVTESKKKTTFSDAGYILEAGRDEKKIF